MYEIKGKRNLCDRNWNSGTLLRDKGTWKMTGAQGNAFGRRRGLLP